MPLCPVFVTLVDKYNKWQTLRTVPLAKLGLDNLTLYLLQEKLKRLIKYLNFKEIKNKTQKQTSQEDDEVLEATGKYCNSYSIN